MPKAKSPDATESDPTWTRPAYQNRSREQRDRLLKAGERAFAASGFWQTHITDIAKRAGCSVGSFYRRFEDKEAFFLALQSDMAARAEANITKFFEDPARDGEGLDELMIRLTRNTARTVRGIEGYYRALFELSLRGQNVWPPMRRVEAIEAEFLVKLFRRRGVAVDDKIQNRAHLAIRMMHGQIISAMLHGPGPWAADEPELHDELGLMLIRYLGIDGATRKTPKT
ncbi:MAG: TetR/AcrR family transcriptional regulator [Alphaproteobacteria bacterium]|nr:TetR/AcrR family transcriptional regulator [Alphaproteobacteria bacterium]MBU1515287.1 TetR/AcrR family transcriptional regulator [Alphaproteobacteria bacterium]MBU2092417.1 TetR/AcrR family transcriptional regulator [Alphaproteobacteria bacterium]MBU2153011.1 TetR/AcrR family transcriptional regulator [Alphaproteobacteria bacterium]MBU2305842.1 TetR/AcrR family transcriptional regulator [Alphaproteobacteria bacterium]